MMSMLMSNSLSACDESTRRWCSTVVVRQYETSEMKSRNMSTPAAMDTAGMRTENARSAWKGAARGGPWTACKSEDGRARVFRNTRRLDFEPKKSETHPWRQKASFLACSPSSS